MNRRTKKELAKRGLRECKHCDITSSIFDLLTVAVAESKENDGNWHKARSGEKL
jgi:hypothetical protein